MTKNAPAAATIRAWARDNGLAVGVRGYISEEVNKAFFAVHTPTGKLKKSRQKAA